MDYNKIGEFISNERKAKKLTQAKLAEMIFVSEKTISKWENGNGIPDTNSLPKLCEVFDVSLNELLNGSRISEEDYKNKAEEELLKLQEQKEKAVKLLFKVEIVLGCVSVIFLLASYIFAAYIIELFNVHVVPGLIMLISLVAFIIAMGYCLKIEQKAGYYVCKRCGHKHVPTYGKVLGAMHCGRTRYMTCPKCNKKSWQKKVLK